MAQGLQTNADGTLRAFTADEIAAMKIRTAGVRDGQHPTRKHDPQGCSVYCDYFCAGDQFVNFRAFMLGGARLFIDGTTSVQTLTRLMPQTFPGEPTYAAIALENVTGAGGAGIDDDSTPFPVPQYPKLRCRVRYENVFFNMLADDLVLDGEFQRYTEVLPSTTETVYLSLAGSTLNYIRSDGTVVLGTGVPPPHKVPIPYGIGRPETVTHFGLKWHRVPKTAWGQVAALLYKRVKGNVAGGIRALGGTVNKTVLMGRDPGTVLFLGVEEEIVPEPVDGGYCWNLIFRFLEKTQGTINQGQGHNCLWYGGNFGTDSGTKGYYFAGTGDHWYQPGSLADPMPDGVALFDERDHTTLFDVG